MNTLSIVLISGLILVLMIKTIVALAEENYLKALLYTIIAFLVYFAAAREKNKLSDKDVLNGKAEYVEKIHISNGDTIKTYHIQPKENK